jgi:hypothetical protein
VRYSGSNGQCTDGRRVRSWGRIVLAAVKNVKVKPVLVPDSCPACSAAMLAFNKRVNVSPAITT